MRFWNNVNVKEMVTVELKGRQSLDKEEFIGIDAQLHMKEFEELTPNWI